MRFQVFHRRVAIAESELDRLDPSMGIANGTFVPTTQFSAAADSFSLRDEQDGARELTSDLELRTSSGDLVPTEWIRLDDFSAVLGNEGYEVTVCADSSETFQRYFGVQGSL
jgi:hypothetical protein